MPNIPSRPWLDESPVESVGTAAEQEAERRYPQSGIMGSTIIQRRTFVAGAEWALEPYRELLEAAREYRDARNAWALEEDTNTRSLGTSLRVTQAEECLLAAAAALPGGTA